MRSRVVAGTPFQRAGSFLPGAGYRSVRGDNVCLPRFRLRCDGRFALPLYSTARCRARVPLPCEPTGWSLGYIYCVFCVFFVLVMRSWGVAGTLSRRSGSFLSGTGYRSRLGNNFCLPRLRLGFNGGSELPLYGTVRCRTRVPCRVAWLTGRWG